MANQLFSKDDIKRLIKKWEEKEQVAIQPATLFYSRFGSSQSAMDDLYEFMALKISHSITRRQKP